MNDQAAKLRQMVLENKNKKARVITVTSGKGGVGKSNFTLNFAIRLKELGKQVVIIDVDLGLANIDVLIGVTTKLSLYDVIQEGKSIWDVIYKSDYGIDIVAGGSGMTDLLKLDESQLEHFMEQIESLSSYADYIILDTGAGLSNEIAKFIVAADDVILLTTPEPTSITDAYAIVKMVNTIEKDVNYQLIINRIYTDEDGKSTADKLQLVAKRFLSVDLPVLGFLPEDKVVHQAVKKQKPFVVAFPEADISAAIREIANKFLDIKVETKEKDGFVGFVKKMIKFMR